MEELTRVVPTGFFDGTMCTIDGKVGAQPIPLGCNKNGWIVVGLYTHPLPVNRFPCAKSGEKMCQYLDPKVVTIKNLGIDIAAK